MRRGARSACAVLALGLAWAGDAAAQVGVDLGIPADPFPVAPHMFAQAHGIDPSLEPIRMNLQISLNNSFGLLAYNDTVAAPNDSATFIVRRLLPQNSTLFFRVLLLDNTGRNFATTDFPGARHTPPWLILVAPNAPNGQTLATTHPTFVWRSGHVDLPPGPWRYDLTVTPTYGAPAFFPYLSDTIFTDSSVALQVATSYRWSVKASLVAGDPADTVRGSSISTFTILPTTAPQVTLLYQNFPNPFPSPTQANTCIWFDIGQRGNARLTVHTLHGDLVRTLVPGLAVADTAGRYGRLVDSSGVVTVVQPCSIYWDGRAQNGRQVQPGVYLLVLTVSGQTFVKKILYQGH